MSEEHILVPQQPEQRVEISLLAAERPAPTQAAERLSDDVFSRDQGRAVAALMGLQAGLAIMHHLAVETFQDDEEEWEKVPRRKPRLEQEPVL